jgi:poly-gamma-glutamate synthesis protein (capsule biosynthesis protein)
MAEKNGEAYTFGCVADLLADADLVVGNLEGPITDNPSRNVGTKGDVPEHYTFTFATTTGLLLAQYNIRLVNLGNNHIGNFGVDGIVSTREHLTRAGIAYFGGLSGDEPVYRDGTRSFVSYNQFGGQPSDAVVDVIAEEHSLGQRVIVYTHWGEEYITSPGYVRDIAQAFVRAGANLVIGSHPHVVIPMEYIDGVPVYYSLGNFIFDQYWDDTVSRGLAVLATFSAEGITTEEYPVVLMQDGSVCRDEVADVGQ